MGQGLEHKSMRKPADPDSGNTDSIFRQHLISLQTFENSVETVENH
jgi:hypothetical protein